MTEAIAHDLHRALIGEIRDRVHREFQGRGCFPATQQLLLRADPSFGWSRRNQVFRTTPHLRAALIATWPIHLLLPARRPASGRSQVLDAKAALGGDGNTFYFNALVLETLEALGEGGGEGFRAMDAALRSECESDFLEYPQADGPAIAWGYFPLKHHRFDPGKPLLGLLFRWGANAADLDSTSMALCRLLKSGSPAADPGAILTLLEDHVHRQGRFGQERLAYDNLVRETDRGILLWVHEKHNELDAGVNVNLACLLAALVPRLDGPGRERAFRLSSGVFRFLGDHAQAGSFAKPAFLMYYSLEALAFLWMRLAGYADALPPGDRKRFDPREDCARLGACLADLLEWELRPGARAFNSFDRFLAIPILALHGRMIPEAWTRREALLEGIEDVTRSAFEFGKFVYPTTLLYGCRALGLCAAWSALEALDRRARPGGD